MGSTSAAIATSPPQQKPAMKDDVIFKCAAKRLTPRYHVRIRWTPAFALDSQDHQWLFPNFSSARNHSYWSTPLCVLRASFRKHSTPRAHSTMNREVSSLVPRWHTCTKKAVLKQSIIEYECIRVIFGQLLNMNAPRCFLPTSFHAHEERFDQRLA